MQRRFSIGAAALVAWMVSAAPASAVEPWDRTIDGIVVESTTPKESHDTPKDDGDDSGRQSNPSGSTAPPTKPGEAPVSLDSWYAAWRRLLTWLSS
ncbi:MAG: hypothetical protein R3F59_24815 [Myxococcota bacterium]